MRNHPQLKKLFARLLIALATLTALAQVRDQGQFAKPSLVGIPPDMNEPALLLHGARLGFVSVERIEANPSRTNRHSTGAIPSVNSASFLPVATYDAGVNPRSVAIADVNGDGRPDVLVSNFESGTTGVLLGNGDGTFLPVVTLSGAGAMAVVDVNRDGKADLLLASGGNVAVLLGNGDGTFHSGVTYDSGGQGEGERSITVADVNGDGHPDLVVSHESLVAPQEDLIGVLLGNGDGTFQKAVSYGSGGWRAWSVAVADVNADGKLDLVVANFCSPSGCVGDGVVGVLLGNGDGTFRTAVTYDPGGILTTSIAVGDVNGDGKPDLLVANGCGSNPDCSSGTVAVLLGNGNGTFQTATAYGSGGYDPVSVAVADVNGDGKFDVMLTNLCQENESGCPGKEVGLLLGNGDGTLQPVINYDSGGSVPGFGSLAWSLLVADVNGDGRLDMVVANGGVSGNGSVGVLLNNSGAPPTTTSLASSLNPARTKFAVTYTATVKSQSGGEVTGTVTFRDGTSTVATVPLAGNQSAYTTSYKTTGTHLMVASYSGDLQNTGSTSPSLTESIFNGYTTTTTLTSSLNPSTYGQKVTWTATVTSSGSVTPTGKVQFTSSGHTIGSATLNSSGVATLTRSNLIADSYPLTAVYAGDADNLPSTSTVLNQAVLQATSTATLTSSPNPSTQGQGVTFTVKISSPTVIPTGPVTFASGKTVLGTAQLSGGKAKLVISSLPIGSTRVTVTYYGDSNIAKSSASVIQTVQ
ncbi:MAG TPA: FG-GAP-like repeat-containing protein [Candidatus Sulfotelmatobacter sp.]|nr:FG-GAP-like repeat-containing protein [Candidatus Sulfotelmatobacter sp.]